MLTKQFMIKCSYFINHFIYGNTDAEQKPLPYRLEAKNRRFYQSFLSARPQKLISLEKFCIWKLHIGAL